MSELLLAILINGIWQGALLLCGGLVAARMLANATAAKRSVLWTVILAAACALPVATSLHPVRGGSRPAAVAVPPVVTREAPPSRESTGVTGGDIAEETKPGRKVITAPRRVGAYVIIGYLGITAVLLVQVLVDVLGMMRLKALADPLPTAVEVLLARSRRDYGVRRAVRFGSSGGVDTPVFVGLLHPMLLLPAGAIDQMGDDELEQAGAHELAHAQRRDDWRVLAERLVRTVLFFNPAVQWMCDRLALEREMACDEWVLAHTHTAPDVYVGTLLRVAERTVSRGRARYASAFTGSCLRRRVEWLLDGELRMRRHVAPHHVAFAILAVAFSGSAIIRGPSFAFTMQGAAAVIAPAVFALSSPRIDDAIDRMEQAGFNGAVLVAIGDSIVTHRGFGVANRATRAPVTTTTQFNSGAIAKMLTAAAILRLEEEGKLSVRDPLSQWIGALPAAKRNATIHDLLTHTAGLTTIGQPVFDSDRDRFVQRVIAAPAEFAPGATIRHTDIGYSVLAVIIEMASGMTYEQYVRQQLLEPAGMTHTWFQSEPARGSVATEYNRSGDPTSAVGARGYMWGRRGAMGVYSSVEDMYRWQRALDSGLFSGAAVARMRSVDLRNPWGSVTGYGWETRISTRGTTVHHVLSNWPGNSVELMHDPATRMTIALVIDNRLDWSDPRYDDVARIALGTASAADLRHLLYRMPELE